MTLGTYKRPVVRIKKYIVSHFDVDIKKKESTTFDHLTPARAFSRQLFKQNRFISLTNENNTVLPI